MGKKKGILAGAVCTAVLLCGFFVLKEADRKEDSLIVNGEPIIQEELESLDKENGERKKLHEKGESIYGPVELTPMQYYKRLTGECEFLLWRLLRKKQR